MNSDNEKVIQEYRRNKIKIQKDRKGPLTNKDREHAMYLAMRRVFTKEEMDLIREKLNEY